MTSALRLEAPPYAPKVLERYFPGRYRDGVVALNVDDLASVKVWEAMTAALRESLEALVDDADSTG